MCFICFPHRSGKLARALFSIRSTRLLRSAGIIWLGAERQLACALPNATVVRNPVNLDHFDAALAWPEDANLRLVAAAAAGGTLQGQLYLLFSSATETLCF